MIRFKSSNLTQVVDELYQNINYLREFKFEFFTNGTIFILISAQK